MLLNAFEGGFGLIRKYVIAKSAEDRFRVSRKVCNGEVGHLRSLALDVLM